MSAGPDDPRGYARCEYCGERIAEDEDAWSDGWGLWCEACAKLERTRL